MIFPVGNETIFSIRSNGEFFIPTIGQKIASFQDMFFCFALAYYCPDTGKYWGQEENGATDDEMVGWYHWPNWYEFEQIPGDGEGQESLVCCSP